MKRVARELSARGCTPVVLRELPSMGRTLIEKIEENGDADYAVVLLTADDRGGLANEKELRARARQNVVFEWGYFLGRINRERVCALYEEGVELPSDLGGFVHIPLDNSDRWKKELLAELRAVGFQLLPD